MIKESIEKFFKNDSILNSNDIDEFDENLITIHYPFTKKSIQYNLPTISNTKFFWNLILKEEERISTFEEFQHLKNINLKIKLILK